MDKNKRLSITISFNNERLYYHVKNQPNSSYYIRKLVEKDIENHNRKTTDEGVDNISDIAINILEW